MASYVWFGLGVGATGCAVFFALVHSALRSFSRARLEEALQKRGRADQLDLLYEHHDELLQLTRALTVLSLVVCTTLALVLATDRFGPTVWGWLIGAALAAGINMILVGIVPLAWADYAAESVLAISLPFCQFCRAVFSPLAWVWRLFDSLVRRLAGVPASAPPASDIAEELASVVDEGKREGAIEEDQKDMIQNIIKFKHADASQIMMPRTDIVSIDTDQPVEAARRLIAKSGFSRIPVTAGNLDKIVGILYAKDLLELASGDRAATLHVKDVMRHPVFVPETKRLDELLREFQADKIHMAVVLDEYGGTSGLVTIEDAVEEIVGEIADEYEPESRKPIRAVSDRAYEVDARAHIDELNDELPVNLPEDDDYETIGGFMLSRLGYIPKAGDSLDHQGLRITVLEAEERRITRLRIDLATQADTPEPP